MDIICFSFDHWDSPLWTNRQHIMSRLSKDNRIIFVDRPTGIMEWLKKRKQGQYKHKKLFNWTRRQSDNLLVHSAFVLPFSRFSIIDKINFWIRLKILRRLVRENNFVNSIVWFYDPIESLFAGKFNE